MHRSTSTLLWIPKPDQTRVAAVSISKTDDFASGIYFNKGGKYLEILKMHGYLLSDRDVFVSGSLRAHFPTSVFEKISI